MGTIFREYVLIYKYMNDYLLRIEDTKKCMYFLYNENGEKQSLAPASAFIIHL